MRFLLILSYDTKDADQAQRVALNIVKESDPSSLRLEGVYTETQLEGA